MTKFLIHNRRTKCTWQASGEEALFYCSFAHGLSQSYIVVDENTGRALEGIELLTIIYKERTARRAKNA